MSEPQQPFGDAEPRPSLAEQIAELLRLIADADRNRIRASRRTGRILRVVLDTLREVEAGEAGEP